MFECYIREYRSYFQWAGLPVQFLAPPSKPHYNAKSGSVACNDFCSIYIYTYTHQYAQSSFWLYQCVQKFKVLPETQETPPYTPETIDII